MMRTIGAIFCFLVFCHTEAIAEDSFELDAAAAELQGKVLLLSKAGRMEEALKLFESAPAPSNTISRVFVSGTKAEILGKAGRHQEAVQILKPIVDTEPLYAWMLGGQLAEELAKAGDFKSAYQYLKNFSKKNGLIASNSEFRLQICELRSAGEHSSETTKQIEFLKNAVRENEKIIGPVHQGKEP